MHGLMPIASVGGDVYQIILITDGLRKMLAHQSKWMNISTP